MQDWIRVSRWPCHMPHVWKYGNFEHTCDCHSEGSSTATDLRQVHSALSTLALLQLDIYSCNNPLLWLLLLLLLPVASVDRLCSREKLRSCVELNMWRKSCHVALRVVAVTSPPPMFILKLPRRDPPAAWSPDQHA